MNNNDRPETVGIGDYRVLNKVSHSAISEILESVRDKVYHGTKLGPLYSFKEAEKKGKTFDEGSEDPDCYYHQSMVISDEEF